MKQPLVLLTFNNTSDKLTNERTVYHTLEQFYTHRSIESNATRITFLTNIGKRNEDLKMSK